MYDALAMDVGDGEKKLTKDAASLGFGEHLIFDEIVIELATCAKLADHPDVLLCCNDFVELHDVGMVKSTMVVDLAGEASGMSLGYLFDGYASVGETMEAETYLAEGAFADRTLKGVVADNLEFGRRELLSKLLIGRCESSLLVDGGAATLTAMMIGSASAGLTHGAMPVDALQRAKRVNVRTIACGSIRAKKWWRRCAR